MKKRIEIFDGKWSISDVKKAPGKIFVFGDNETRRGKGGQAVIRDLPNVIGIRTKKKPTTDSDAYWTDDDLELNKRKIMEDINSIRLELMFGKTIVLARGGYGTGLSKLKEKAPLTFEYLCKAIIENLYFDNETGQSFVRIPSHKDMSAAKEIPMNYEHGKKAFGQESPGYFRKELVEKGITTTFEAIKSGLRTATTRSERYNSGDLIKVTSDKTKDYLVCRAITDSYQVSSISKEDWSKLEGWDISYFKLNPGIENKFQFQFEWICLVDGVTEKQTFNPRLI